MGNNNSNQNQALYDPSHGVVLDQESAMLRHAEKNAKPKSDNMISPYINALDDENSKILPNSSKNKENSSETKKIAKKFDLIIEKLSKNNELFQDLDFSPETKHISENITAFLPSLQQNEILWERPNNLFHNTIYQLFKDDIIPNDIQQGSLGDCYFLSALAAIAEKPRLIIKLFENKQVNKYGCYSLFLFIDGQCENIILDDYFPVMKTPISSNISLIFSRSNGPELWVILLEKAYAKIHGSYEKIEAGLCEEALRDLTGAPSEKLNDFNEKEAWDFMKNAYDNNYLMIVASEHEKNESKKGIVSGHCYSVLDLKLVKLSDGTEKIVKLRNPWGHKEWTGDWSDESTKWTEELRKQLEWEKKDDGVFWMNIKDFCGYYSEINVCQIHEDYVYSSMRYIFNEDYHKIIGFKISQSCENVFLTISQIDKRKMDKTYSYSYLRMILCKFDKNEVFLCEENTGKMRDLTINAKNLSTGTYVIFFELDTNIKNKTLTLSSYTSFSLDFKEIKVEKIDFLESLFNNFAKSSTFKEKVTYIYDKTLEIQRITCRITDYIFICYVNDTEKYALKEDLEFSEQTNFVQLDNKPIEKKYDINVKPLSKYSLKFKSLLNTNKDSFSTFKFHSSSLFTYNSNFEKITDEILKNPFKTLQRKMNENLIDVFVYVFYKAGILGFLFHNKMNKNYKEATCFQTKNLKAKNFEANSLKVHLQPSEKFFIFFEIIDQNCEVYYKMSYVPIMY